MKPIILNDDEISEINSFIEEAKKIPAVESILLSAFSNVMSPNGEEVVELMTVIDESEKHGISSEETKDGKEKLFKLVEKYGEPPYFKSERVCISGWPSYVFSLAFSNPTQVVTMQALVNGTILYDKFGELTEKRNQALSNKKLGEKLVEDVPAIENIGKITGETQVTTPTTGSAAARR